MVIVQRGDWAGANALDGKFEACGNVGWMGGDDGSRNAWMERWASKAWHRPLQSPQKWHQWELRRITWEKQATTIQPGPVLRFPGPGAKLKIGALLGVNCEIVNY